MSNSDMPTDEEIREQLLWEFDGDREARAGILFDRWLAKVRADAWDIGSSAVLDLRNLGDRYQTVVRNPLPPNPYREEQ